jgi:putative spermidine/putrescine transport system substrate-binding protein
MVVNADMVKTLPTDWSDLLKPEFKGSVALSGDPRVSNQAIQAVFAAGLSVTNGDVPKAAEAGLKYFAELNKKGNFVPVTGQAASIAQGTTPVVILWDYNGLSARDNLKGNPKVEVIVPKSGVVAGVYIQAISAFAPHPAAAKLWMEHLYSDDGQIGWLKGYCHPIRFQDLAAKKKIPESVLAKLPAAENYTKAVFPTLEQQNASKEVTSKQWDTVVGANVTK